MFAKRTQEVEPFLAMEVMERGMAMARAGIPILQLHGCFGRHHGGNAGSSSPVGAHVSLHAGAVR